MPAQCRAFLFSSIPLCVFASPLVAQTWSSEQQAVLAVVEQSWVDDLGKDATWLDRLTHPEMLSWSDDVPVPRAQTDSKRWNEYGHENSTSLIHTIAPVGIAIRGDAAVVHYYATNGAEDRQGERETTTSRCTDTLTRAGNTWRYLGWFCFNEPDDGN
jgi:hypothetical protein